MNHNLIKGERCPVIIYLYSGCPAKLDNCVVGLVTNTNVANHEKQSNVL